VKLEVASLKPFDKPVQTLKVNCQKSSETAKPASALRSFEEAEKPHRTRRSPVHAASPHQQRGVVRIFRVADCLDG
jgi:hypothetical protein